MERKRSSDRRRKERRGENIPISIDRRKKKDRRNGKDRRKEKF